MHRHLATITAMTGMPDSSPAPEWHVMPKLDLTRRRLSLALALTAGAATGRGVCSGSGVEIWVELSERPPAPETAASDAVRQRDRVALQQAQVGQALSRLGAVELARTRTHQNAIAVRIDRSRLDEVRAIDGVKGVRPARSLHPPQTGGAP
jgi:hypothetical protein